MNYTYMKGCALCMTLCLTSAALPGRANAESSAIVNEVLQSSVVKGVVKDSNGEPLLGVNVLVKGTTIGAVTDIDGNFSFEAPAGCTLVISYIGFESQEVKVKGNAPLNIILKEDSEAFSPFKELPPRIIMLGDSPGAATLFCTITPAICPCKA